MNSGVIPDHPNTQCLSNRKLCEKSDLWLVLYPNNFLQGKRLVEWGTNQRDFLHMLSRRVYKTVHKNSRSSVDGLSIFVIHSLLNQKAPYSHPSSHAQFLKFLQMQMIK